jgi:hypothetical protein
MRKTTSYLLSVNTIENPNPIADALIEAYPGEVEASGVGKQRAFIRFRASSPEEAIEIAESMRIRWEWELSFGYGVHKKVIRRGSR